MGDLPELLDSVGLSGDATNQLYTEGITSIGDLAYLEEQDIQNLPIQMRDKARLRTAVRACSQQVDQDVVRVEEPPRTMPVPNQATKIKPPPRPEPPRIPDIRQREIPRSPRVDVSHKSHRGLSSAHRGTYIDPTFGRFSQATPKDEGVDTDEPMGIDLEYLKQQSKLLPVSGKLEQYQLPLRDMGESEKLKLRRMQFGKPPSYTKEKSILVVGESGAGKSTMIDAIVNHLFGITPEYNMRFRIISAKGEDVPALKQGTESQTDWITSYTIHQIPGSNIPFTLNIVDTPGFADTRGIVKDKQISQQIKELFQSTESHGLLTLDAVCFVVKSSLNRMTANLRYVLDSVLALFGKNLEKNICILCTFSDGSESEAMKCLDNIPYSAFLHFNNQWLKPSASNELQNAVFSIGQESFKELITFIEAATPQSLRMSVEVLDERLNLEESVERIQGLISTMFGQIVNVDKIAKIMHARKQQPIRVQKNSLSKQLTTKKNMNCTECKYTCRYDITKLKRFVAKKFKANTLCGVCTCAVSNHRFEKYIIKQEFFSDVITFKELQEQYGDHSERAMNKEKSDLLDKVNKALRRMKSSIDRLNEIALRPAIRSSNDYIDMVIKREETDMKPDYEERMKLMKKMKEANDLFIEMWRNDEDSDYL